MYELLLCGAGQLFGDQSSLQDALPFLLTEENRVTEVWHGE